MKAGDKSILLTPKGVEELRGRIPKLDSNARDILSLIDQGSASEEAILRRSKSTRDEVTDGLRLLLSNGFIETSSSDSTVRAETPAPTPSVSDTVSERLRLKPGISPSQARFALSNFCLDQFGTNGKDLADAVGFEQRHASSRFRPVGYLPTGSRNQRKFAAKGAYATANCLRHRRLTPACGREGAANARRALRSNM